MYILLQCNGKSSHRFKVKYMKKQMFGCTQCWIIKPFWQRKHFKPHVCTWQHFPKTDSKCYAHIYKDWNWHFQLKSLFLMVYPIYVAALGSFSTNCFYIWMRVCITQSHPFVIQLHLQGFSAIFSNYNGCHKKNRCNLLFSMVERWCNDVFTIASLWYIFNNLSVLIF